VIIHIFEQFRSIGKEILPLQYRQLYKRSHNSASSRPLAMFYCNSFK